MSLGPSSRSTIERAVVGRGEGTIQTAVHIGFVVCMAVFAMLYVNTYLSLISAWAHTGTFQYAFLIFPISAVLVWARRHWLARVAARPQPRALWAVAALGALWLIGTVADINLAQHIAVVVIWPVLVYLFYGPRVAGVLAFALGYLLFAIPFGNFMVGPLQTVTAHLAVYALRLTGQPVLMSGHFINTPATTWHVAEACSGIKFFVATTAFGVLYAYLFFTSLRRRLIFVAFALVVPIIANGLRVYFTILIGEYFGLEYATGTDHLIFGWQFFGTVLVILFFCGWPWHQPPGEGPIPDIGLPERGSRRMRWMIPATLVLIVLPVAWYTGASLRAATAGTSGPNALPTQLADYAALDEGGDESASPSVRDLDVHLARRYGDFMRPIQVTYLGMDAGRYGTDIIHLRRGLYNPSNWHVVAGPEVVRPHPDGPVFVKLTLHPVHGGKNRMLLYSYRIGSRWLASPWWFKFWLSVDRLLGRPAMTGVLIVSTAGKSTPARLPGVAAAATHALQ